MQHPECRTASGEGIHSGFAAGATGYGKVTSVGQRLIVRAA